MPTLDSVLYIAGVYDCFDSECVDLSMDNNMRDELTQSALAMAARKYNIKGATFHSDFGSQYTSNDFKKLVSKLGITQSMRVLPNSLVMAMLNAKAYLTDLRLRQVSHQEHGSS